jgi:hypothetical protein
MEWIIDLISDRLAGHEIVDLVVQIDETLSCLSLDVDTTDEQSELSSDTGIPLLLEERELVGDGRFLLFCSSCGFLLLFFSLHDNDDDLLELFFFLWLFLGGLSRRLVSSSSLTSTTTY